MSQPQGTPPPVVRHTNTAGAAACAKYGLAAQAVACGMFAVLANIVHRPRAYAALELLAYSVPILGLLASIAAVFAAIIEQRPAWLAVPPCALLIAAAFYFTAIAFMAGG